MNSSSKIAQIFEPDGPLAKRLPGFEPRPDQARMALAVWQALNDRELALIEAGTGTGKTLAYLAPAVLLGRRVVLSTGTKTLQEQLVNKDIPALRQAGFRFEHALMKGRGNYLCPVRLQRFLAEPLLEIAGERRYFQRFVEWAAATKTGDRAELTGFPDSLRFWDDVCSSTNHCQGGRCDFFTSCFVARMRQAAARADVVVVNHHLYFANLALQRHGPGEVLPEHDAVVFDEAHGLEDVATEHFGVALSRQRLAELTRDLRAFLTALKLAPAPVLRAATALDERGRGLFHLVENLPGDDRFRLDEQSLDRLGKVAGQDVHDALEALADELGKAMPKDRPVDLEAIVRRCGELRRDLSVLLDTQDRGHVRWVERRPRSSQLNASPIDVTAQLDQCLFSAEAGLSMVLTSATLTAGGNFAFIRKRLGIEREALELTLPPLFDFKRQTRLYVPRDLPEPMDPTFVERLAVRLTEFLRATSGRALVLFTSFRNMHGVHQRLPADLPFNVLLQGQGPKGVLLERFREDTSSVLLATASFWQGVDVVGESLSAVFIDKLPFASPGEPITAARIEASQVRGEDPFWGYQVPLAILTLKQGLGRLIRGPSDYGVLAIADVRLHTKGYGRRIMANLPPSPLINDIAEVSAFLASTN